MRQGPRMFDVPYLHLVLAVHRVHRDRTESMPS